MTVPTPTAPLMQGRESLTNQRVSTEQTPKKKGAPVSAPFLASVSSLRLHHFVYSFCGNGSRPIPFLVMPAAGGVASASAATGRMPTTAGCAAMATAARCAHSAATTRRTGTGTAIAWSCTSASRVFTRRRTSDDRLPHIQLRPRTSALRSAVYRAVGVHLRTRRSAIPIAAAVAAIFGPNRSVPLAPGRLATGSLAARRSKRTEAIPADRRTRGLADAPLHATLSIPASGITRSRIAQARRNRRTI
jgi:hypothetical protein